jgi:subtilisin family serine protease
MFARSQTPSGRGRRWAVLPAVSLVALAVAPALASADTHPPAYVPGEVIVKFRPGLSTAERTDALADRRARLARHPGVPRTVLARVPAGADVRQTVAALERDPRVAWAEPNAYRTAGAVPNDPFLSQQWGLLNTGQTVDGVTGMADADIDAPEAWDVTTGAPDVKVAVVDSGVNFDQPDLAPNLWRNPGESGGGRDINGVDDDGNGFVDDVRGWDFVQRDSYPSDNFGHGSLVAGTLAARGGNGLGISGVAPRTTLIPVRVLGNAGVGTCASIASGMEYAVRAGARIVNVSVGSREPCQIERDVIDAAPNTLFVFSAMNDGVDIDATPDYPCSYRLANIVCVAATDSSDRLAGFSNYGARTVDLAAPGKGIFSTYVKWGATQEVFSDDFETPLTGRWVTGGTPDTWARTPFVQTRSGGFALSNSTVGTYANNTQNWAQLNTGLDLTGKRDCAATIWVKKSLGSSGDHDMLIADPSRDGVHPGTWTTGQLGTNSGFEKWLIDLAPLDGYSTGSLRFWLDTDASGTGGGVALDDLRVFCVPPVTSYSGAADEFLAADGTSFAAPQVSGVAALLLSLDPGLTAVQLKQRILATADPLPGLTGRTVTGSRLNAARAVRESSPAAPPPAGGTPGEPSRAAVAQALAAQAGAVATALRTAGIRALARRGGLVGARLLVPGSGRLTVKLRSAGRTIATGACSAARVDRRRLDIRLTRRGRALLHRARRLRVTVVLAFAPRSGAPIVRRATTRLARPSQTPRQGGSR